MRSASSLTQRKIHPHPHTQRHIHTTKSLTTTKRSSKKKTERLMENQNFLLAPWLYDLQGESWRLRFRLSPVQGRHRAVNSINTLPHNNTRSSLMSLTKQAQVPAGYLIHGFFEAEVKEKEKRRERRGETEGQILMPVLGRSPSCSNQSFYLWFTLVDIPPSPLTPFPTSIPLPYRSDRLWRQWIPFPERHKCGMCCKVASGYRWLGRCGTEAGIYA